MVYSGQNKHSMGVKKLSLERMNSLFYQLFMFDSCKSIYTKKCCFLFSINFFHFMFVEADYDFFCVIQS